MFKVLEKLDKELEVLAKDPNNIKDYSRFEKDKTKKNDFAGSVLKKVSIKYFQQVKHLEEKDIFSFCEKLLKSERMGRRTIAFEWAFRVRKNYQKEDFKIFENWLKKYVNSWSSCDDLCTHALGYFIWQFPKFIPRVKKWTKSKNRWLKRASAVSLIYSVRRKEGLRSIFDVSTQLIQDKDDLVQKGYGWSLKEASNIFPREVFKYVLKHKDKMPRTALRYAVEKMPKRWKKQAMKKD